MKGCICPFYYDVTTECLFIYLTVILTFSFFSALCQDKFFDPTIRVFLEMRLSVCRINILSRVTNQRNI